MARFAEISPALIDVRQYGRAVTFPFDISGSAESDATGTVKFQQMGMACAIPPD